MVKVIPLFFMSYFSHFRNIISIMEIRNIYINESVDRNERTCWKYTVNNIMEK